MSSRRDATARILDRLSHESAGSREQRAKRVCLQTRKQGRAPSASLALTGSFTWTRSRPAFRNRLDPLLALCLLPRALGPKLITKLYSVLDSIGRSVDVTPPVSIRCHVDPRVMRGCGDFGPKIDVTESSGEGYINGPWGAASWNKFISDAVRSGSAE